MIALSQTAGAALETDGSQSGLNRHGFPNLPPGHRRRFMRKAYGRPGPLPLLVAACALTIGCRQDFFDQPFGVLDLASVYDGGTSTNPSAGIPDQIDPQLGYVDSAQAEYYDFGSIPVQRNPFTGQ